MADTLGYIRLQGVIKGTGLPQGRIDTPKIRIEHSAGRCRWKHIARGGKRRKNHINFVDAVWKVNSTRANISYGQGKRGGQLPGDSQIPLHYVIAFGMEFIEAAKPEVRLITERLKRTGWEHAGLKRIGEDRIDKRFSQLK